MPTYILFGISEMPREISYAIALQALTTRVVIARQLAVDAGLAQYNRVNLRRVLWTRIVLEAIN